MRPATARGRHAISLAERTDRDAAAPAAHRQVRECPRDGRVAQRVIADDWRRRLSTGRPDRRRPTAQHERLAGRGREPAPGRQARAGRATTRPTGLRRLGTVTGAPLVPEVVVDDDILLVTTASTRPRTPDTDDDFGHALATLHETTLPRRAAVRRRSGPARSTRPPFPDGAGFSGRPTAASSPHDAAWSDPVSSVVARLPDAAGTRRPRARARRPVVGQRAVRNRQRTWLIDPSVHGGHPEEDLAMLALFGPVPAVARRLPGGAPASRRVARAPPLFPALPAAGACRPLRRRLPRACARHRTALRLTSTTPCARTTSRRSDRAHAHPHPHGVLALRTQMRLGMDDLVTHARAAGPTASVAWPAWTTWRHRARSPTHVRGDDHRNAWIAARTDPTSASARSCSATPSSPSRPGQGGDHDQPRLGGALRARHRLGLGDR